MAYGIPLSTYATEWLESEFERLSKRHDTTEKIYSAIKHDPPSHKALSETVMFIERLKDLKWAAAVTIASKHLSDFENRLSEVPSDDITPNRAIDVGNLFEGYEGYMYRIQGTDNGKYTVFPVTDSPVIVRDKNKDTQNGQDGWSEYVKILETYPRGPVKIIIHDNHGYARQDKTFYVSDVQLFADIAYGRLVPEMQEG